MAYQISERELRKLRRDAVREQEIQNMQNNEEEMVITDRNQRQYGNNPLRDYYDWSDRQLNENRDVAEEIRRRENYQMLNREISHRSERDREHHYQMDNSDRINIPINGHGDRLDRLRLHEGRQGTDATSMPDINQRINRPVVSTTRSETGDDGKVQYDLNNRTDKDDLRDKAKDNRKSVSFEIDRHRIGKTDKAENESIQAQALDSSIFNLTEEMTKLDRKLSLLRQSNADILNENSVFTSTRNIKTQDVDTQNVDTRRDSNSDKRVYEDMHGDLTKDPYCFNTRRNANSEIHQPHLPPITEHHKMSTLKDFRMPMTYRNTGQKVIVDNDEYQYYDTYANKDKYHDIDENDIQYEIKKEKDTGQKVIVDNDEYQYYDRYTNKHKYHNTNQNDIQYEIKRERDLLQRLHEENRIIDLKRQTTEEEEQKVLQRIQSLKLAEEKLDEQRKEREKLQIEIQKKSELEGLRIQRLTLLKKQEEELAFKLENKRRDVGNYTNIKEDYSERSRYEYNPRDMNKDIETTHRKGGRVIGEIHRINESSDITDDKPKQCTGFGKPKIPPFDGNDFKVWKIEVECIIKSRMYPESLIAQTMRNSLKGQTRKILLTIDPMASSDEILRKLEDIYGTTQTEDSIMQDFFNAKQEEKETTSDWALRLETIMQLAVETGELPERKKNSLLKQRFWKGLKSEKLRNNTRVTFESTASFEILRKKARVEEEELKRTTEVKTQRPLTSTQEKSEQEPNTSLQSEVTLQQQHMKTSTNLMNEQMNMMKTLMEKMGQLEKEIANIQSDNKQHQIQTEEEQHYRHPPSLGYRGMSYRGRYQRPGRPYYSYHGQPRGRGRPYYKDWFDKFDHTRSPVKDNTEPPKSEEPTSSNQQPEKKEHENRETLNK